MRPIRLVFTTTQTWRVPAGVTQLLVGVLGGGGGGGGGATATATPNQWRPSGAGGGAAFFSEHVVPVTSYEELTITIGAAGLVGAVGTPGGDGVATSVIGSSLFLYGVGGSGGFGTSTFVTDVATQRLFTLGGGYGLARRSLLLTYDETYANVCSIYPAMGLGDGGWGCTSLVTNLAGLAAASPGSYAPFYLGLAPSNASGGVHGADSGSNRGGGGGGGGGSTPFGVGGQGGIGASGAAGVGGSASPGSAATGYGAGGGGGGAGGAPGSGTSTGGLGGVGTPGRVSITILG